MTDSRYYATGRRKEATARVWVSKGDGSISVNGKNIHDYFRRDVLKLVINQCFDVTETQGEYSVRATVRGGGHTGQAGAIRHGLARALTLANPELRSPLKKAGFLTRDARKVERKKYGRPGARKRFQYSKR